MNIGHYNLVGEIGHGGMGVVLKATDSRNSRPVAIKLINKTGIWDEQARVALVREAGATTSLRHPNVVSIYDVNQYKGNLYIVMEYLDGASVERLIRRRWPLGLRHRLQIIVQLCEALAYAHERNIVHRDVKPANMLIMRDGNVKVLDFGLGARAQISGSKQNRWSGTVPYMSPEQVNGSDIDGRSDLWSAGVTLFELVTGKLPFAGDTNSVFRQILNSPVPEIPNNIPLSDELNQILRCAMHKQREERFSTGDLFAAELRRVLPFAQSHPWTPPPTEAKVTDGLTQATIVAFSLTPELNQVPRPVYETHPSLAQKGVEGQPADPGIYNLPDVGFTHRPGGEVIISSGRFSLIAVRNRMLDARPKVVTKLIIYSFFGYCALLMLHLSWKIGSEDLLGGAVVVIASVIAVAWLSISATIQAARLLERLRIYTRCTKCRRPLSPRSVWTRFVKSKIEIELGYRDCLAALKGGFWEDAAKLVCIHGAERVSLYASRSIDTPLRYNLQFYECNACILHVARLTTDELVEEKWLTRPEFVQATSAGIRTETTR